MTRKRGTQGDIHGRHSRQEDCNGLELHDDEDLVFERLPGEMIRW